LGSSDADEARMTERREGASLVLAFDGRLDIGAAARLWTPATRAARSAPALRLDLTGLQEVDTAGAVLLLSAADAAPQAEIAGPSDAVAAVLERTRKALAAAPRARQVDRGNPVEGIGRLTVGRFRNLRSSVAFMGEATVTALRTLVRPWSPRFGDLLRHLDETGLRAFPLTALLGFLIGVILAYQSAIPLRRFGAEVFVPNLVGISLLRELGPLLAGVVLAGRTGSAFAAELGTMTVNEEVDALRIMGIDPMAMLVLPRLIAAILVMPVLALLMNLAGLAGMTLIMASFGFPWAAVSSQLQQWLSVQDLAGGLFKAACFGVAIAAIGCRAGLGAGRGPRAVGDAATQAVVGGIISIVALDGVFAVLFFRLGI